MSDMEKITVSLPKGVRARLKMIALLRSVSLQTLVSDVLITAVNEAIDNKGSRPPPGEGPKHDCTPVG